MNKKFLATSILCVLGLCAWAAPAVVGDDDRQEITGGASGVEQAAVSLEIETVDGEKGICSGSIIGHSVVITAAHCLIKEGKYAKKVAVVVTGMDTSAVRKYIQKEQNFKNPIIKKRNSNSLERSKIKKISQELADKFSNDFHKLMMISAKSQVIWLNPQYIKSLERGDGDKIIYDYAFILLNKPLGKEIGHLTLHASSDEELLDSSIMTIGRGWDKPSRTLWKSKGKVGVVHSYYFWHNADTEHGNSGGPILNANNEIIGLSNFSRRQLSEEAECFPNGGLRITQEIIDAAASFAENAKVIGHSTL